MKKFSEKELEVYRSLSVEDVLKALEKLGRIYYSENPEFRPRTSKKTKSFMVSVDNKPAVEVIATGIRFCDKLAYQQGEKTGGGGGIDLVMFLFGLNFVKATYLLRSALLRLEGNS